MSEHKSPETDPDEIVQLTFLMRRRHAAAHLRTFRDLSTVIEAAIGPVNQDQLEVDVTAGYDPRFVTELTDAEGKKVAGIAYRNLLAYASDGGGSESYARRLDELFRERGHRRAPALDDMCVYDENGESLGLRADSAGAVLELMREGQLIQRPPGSGRIDGNIGQGSVDFWEGFCQKLRPGAEV